MINPISVEKQAKVELLENMLTVALIDGRFEEVEKNYLSNRAQAYGFTLQEVEALLNTSPLLQDSAFKEQPITFRPTTTLYKEEMLADAVFMSLTNGEMDPKEYALCIQLAERIGMDKQDLDEVIEEANTAYKKLGM